MSSKPFSENPPLATGSSCETRSGVSATPTRFETDALQSAAGTLPRAIEVKAIEDWTVEGNRHRKRSPAVMSAGK